MRICLIAESYAPALGGVEFALQNLVQGFLSRGHEVRVIAASWEGHASGIETQGQLTIVRIRTFPFFRRFWFILFSIPSAIRGAAWAEIVQGSTFAGGVPAFLGAWLTGRKKLLLVHEVLGKRWFRFEPNPISALFYYLTEWIIVHLPFDHYETPSQFTKESLQSIGLPGSKISVIYHGDSKFEEAAISTKEIREELGFKEDDFVYLAFGRAGVTKGFEYFVDAIADISRQIPAARFELILSHYDSRLSRRIKDVIAQLPPHVCKLVPPLPRSVLASHVQASDCIVIPSLSEGFGFSALEACNAGKIVVSTDAGSLPEVIFGRHVFVRAGSGHAIAEGCVKAYSEEVGEIPEKLFSWKKSGSEYLQLYEQLLSSSRTLSRSKL
jgi:D-inositol-3-phosphate glycosyltransferase